MLTNDFVPKGRNVALIDGIFSRTFEAAARVRRARVFHPVGVSLTGVMQVVDPQFEQLLGASERPVVARISKGLGLPGGIPDVLGLAVRLLDSHDRPWDLALATTGTSPLTRLLPRPARSWGSARYGSLMAYRFDGGAAVWLCAEPDVPQPESVDLDDFSEVLRAQGASFTLTAVSRAGSGRLLARILVTEPEIGDAPGFFDPMRNLPPEVELAPHLLGTVREWAYTGSRRGRGEPAEPVKAEPANTDSVTAVLDIHN